MLISLDRSNRVILLFALIGAAFTGCTSADGAPESDLNVRTERDRSEWRLPLDDHLGAMAPRRHTLAVDTILHSCLSQHEIPYPTPRLLDDVEAMPTVNSAARGIFNVELAKKFGYGSGPFDAEANKRARQDMERFFAATGTPEGKAAADECREQAEGQVPEPPDTMLAQALVFEANDAARLDDDVVEATERWRECMEVAGIPDLPETPFDMPTEAMTNRMRHGPRGEADGGLDRPWQPPSTEEIELAVADAECRESSGFAETFYEKEWDAQLELMAPRVDELEQLAEALQEFDQELNQVLAELE